jgi:hypothetical protein
MSSLRPAIPNKFLERAFALADSGNFHKVADIRDALIAERHSRSDVARLAGPALSRQLQAELALLANLVNDSGYKMARISLIRRAMRMSRRREATGDFSLGLPMPIVAIPRGLGSAYALDQR